MKRIKKIVGVLLSAVMLLGTVIPAGAATEATEEPELLVQYLFESGGKDSSGNNNHATIGEGVTVSNGIAYLPGGTSSSTAYITLPIGIFDNKDELTISMWLRDTDPQDSWLGAFFLGSAANSNSMPENYYYFVPCEKDANTLKSVMTGSINSSSPYSTEVGIAKSVNTTAYRNKWTHYTITLQPGSMTCYINGQEVETASVSRTISDFGSNLEAYIGKSNYLNDPIYQGEFKDFRIYDGILSSQEVKTVMKENMGDIEVDTYTYSMEIDGNNVTKQLSDSLYGLFYEDINSAADGGLYPEMVKNYSFENAYLQSGDTSSSYFLENGYETVGHYKLHWDVTPSDSFAVEAADSLNENNPHYAVITGDAVMKNGGFAPQDDPNGAAMPVKPLDASAKTGTYTFSAYVKAESGYTGELTVKIVDANGNAITDEQTVSVNADGTWKKVSADLTSTVSANTKGKMELSVEGAASDAQLMMDMVSIVPHDSYGYGDKNYAYGVGVRRDLIEAMMDLNPQFMRFPGGCIVEGFNWEGIYDWRDTIGSLETRKINTNRWENWNNQNRTWGYMQSYGFGYHELLSLCEDYGMEAFPILSAGVLCQYETANVTAKTGEDLQFFIDMATDLLDYCWGDPAQNEWAAKRAENGHAEPFDLKYLGIGNENFQAKYFDNFDAIKAAVEAYVAENYPERELTIISSAGPTSTGDNLEYAYDRLAQTMPGETLVDEHYYESESFMYNQSDRYNYYYRTDQGGSEVFVGEYAVKNDNKYNTALAEAAYITGLERNADIVTNISYAPLLYKVGNLNWSHDLIYFDEFDVAKSTNYYVQQMFGQNYGTQLINTELEGDGKDFSNYGSPIIGMSYTEGYIDKITVYDENGGILLEDDFLDDSTGWERFDTQVDWIGDDLSYEIRDGKMYFNSTNGVNLYYLPRAVEEKWSNFKIVVEGAVKTAGNDSFMIGAGHENQYYFYNMGKDVNNGVYMEVTRPERGATTLTRKILGNNYANKHYQNEDFLRIQTNDVMEITFNFGVDGKLEGKYTSSVISAEDTQRYDFSSDFYQYQTDIYQVVNMDEENVYIKLVNPDSVTKTIDLTFSNLSISTEEPAEITMLTGGLNDANAIGNEVVVPQTSEMMVTDNLLAYELPARSVNVIRVPLTQEKQTLPFTDVSEGDWFYDAVYTNYFDGLMTGMTATTFAPLETLSRSQLALILYRIEGSPEMTYSDVFSDVEDGQWYTSAVLWAQANGIVTGYGNSDMFGPHDRISREQIAVMMYRYANYKKYDTGASAELNAYTDAADVSAYAETAVKWAVGTGIITGKQNGTAIEPQGNTLRAECATIIYRFMGHYK